MSLYTIDASVLGSAVFSDEPAHADSRSLLERVQARELPVVVPSLLLPELAALVARRTGGVHQAVRLVDRLRTLPSFTFVPLGNELARQAAEIAARYQLRGANAACVTVARRYGAVLVTLDRQQLDRAGGVVESQRPAEVLSARG